MNIAVTGTITHNNSFQQNHFFQKGRKGKPFFTSQYGISYYLFAYEYTANASANLRQHKKFMYLF